MQVNLSKDELEEYVAMVFPYTNVGDIEVSRELMKAIFGTAKKNIQSVVLTVSTAKMKQLKSPQLTFFFL